MIALPFNDGACLGSITEVIAELVQNHDPVLAEIAQKHETTNRLASWIRSLPQRDDEGDAKDGPKVEACDPPQRLRIPADDPNCVERAALYIAVAELIDAEPVRQLATLELPIGLHTLPVENGSPVILDPKVQRNCINCGLALAASGPATIEPQDAIQWTADLAEHDVRATRNGPSRVRRARNAVMRLVDHGVPPTRADADSIGWMFAVAERAAQRWGHKALAMVRTTALAIAEVAEEVLAHAQRNLELAGLHFDAPQWLTHIAKTAGRIGLDIGSAALRSEMDKLGIGDDMIGLVESELNREGLSLGALAHRPKLRTFATIRRAGA